MNIYEISIRPHAQMLLRAAIVAMILIGVALLAGRASAQVVAQKVTLRSVVTVADAVVLLGDLAEGAGEKAGAKLFLAPAPGTTGTVQADRVVDAIRRAGIAEVETGGITEVVVSRSGRRIPREEITRAIATELVHRGHARNADQLEIRLDSSVGGFIVESTAAGAIRVMSIQADPRARRFAAKVTVDGSATAARGIEITGYAEEVASVPTLSRPVQRGDTIAPADVIVEFNGERVELMIQAGETIDLTTHLNPCNIADFNDDGQLNFFDVSEFLVAYQSQEARADLNNDGQFNFFDVSTFLQAYSIGCP